MKNHIFCCWPLRLLFLTPATRNRAIGRQAGSISFPSVSVTLTASSVVGSVSITKRSPCSAMTYQWTSLRKTIWVPDGALAGWYSSKLSASGAVGVRFVWLEPSAFITRSPIRASAASLSWIAACMSNPPMTSMLDLRRIALRVDGAVERLVPRELLPLMQVSSCALAPLMVQLATSRRGGLFTGRTLRGEFTERRSLAVVDC